MVIVNDHHSLSVYLDAERGAEAPLYPSSLGSNRLGNRFRSNGCCHGCLTITRGSFLAHFPLLSHTEAE